MVGQCKDVYVKVIDNLAVMREETVEGRGGGVLTVVLGQVEAFIHWVHDVHVLSHLFKVNIKILSTHWSVMGVAPIIYKRKL